MSQDKRRKWTSADKLRIVMAGMQADVDVAELCRREGINPTQYYGWKKQVLSSATKIFLVVKSKTGPVSLRPGFTAIGQGAPASVGVPLNTPVIFHRLPLSSPT